MMQVNNKFNIGDKVYFIDSNSNMKAKCDEITGIFAVVRSDRTKVSYDLKNKPTSVDEEQVFASESDLKDYVFKDLIDFV